jgi:hypothetical protein
MVIILKKCIHKAFKIHTRYHLDKTLGDTGRHKNVWENTFAVRIKKNKSTNDLISKFNT